MMSGHALLRRLALVPVTLFGASVIVFVLLRIIPGDPVLLMAGPGASAADLQALREGLGLDRSIPVQFVSWLAGIVHGDLGRSLSFRTDVVQVVL